MSETHVLGLDGRVVIVSGAAGGGIGTSVTRSIAESGATVVAVSRSESNIAGNIAPLIAEGLSVVPVVADVSTDDGIATVMEKVRTTEGALHGLVNVAGGAAPSTWMPSTRVTREDWRALFNQNLETMFFLSQAVAAELMSQKSGGSIVSVSSISGMNTAPFHIAYGTAKAGLVAATRTMAVELSEYDIRVNAIAPGVTATPASKTFVEEDPERDRRAITMGRRGLPEEQAGAILFLLSNLSTYITGQTLLVDGGLNLKWTHMGADHTSLFLRDEAFRDAISH